MAAISPAGAAPAQSLGGVNENDVQSSSASTSSGTIGDRSNLARLPLADVRLLPRLRGSQIFFILLSGMIGNNVFSGVGVVLKVSGPFGLLAGTFFSGVVAICVGETTSELSQVFRVPNAAFLYVKYWLGDEDIAYGVATLYWFSWANIFGQEMISAANLLGFWELEEIWPPLIFFCLVPLALVTLNLFPVNIFGWIETAGGAIKLLFSLAVTLIFYHIHAIGKYQMVEGALHSRKSVMLSHTISFFIQKPTIDDGFQNDALYASNPFTAFCYALPSLMLGYLGTEAIMIAAYEARSRTEIGWPSKYIHWIVSLVYFFCTLGVVLVVSWTNGQLSKPFGPTAPDKRSIQDLPLLILPRNANSTHSPTVWAMFLLDNLPALPGVVNGFLIFCVLSAGNTSLYYGSRILWGLTYDLRGFSLLSNLFRGLSVPMRRTGAPARAILFTWVAFCWIPLLRVKDDKVNPYDFLQVLALPTCLACFVVWLAILVSYLRFRRCTARFADELQAEYSEYLHQQPRYLADNFLLTLQPFAAILGIIGIIFVFVCTSAMWWLPPIKPYTFFAAYGAQLGLIVYIFVVKLYRGRLWTWFDNHLNTAEGVMEVLDEFRRLSEGDEDRRRSQVHPAEYNAAQNDQAPDREGDPSNAGGLSRIGGDAEHGDHPEPAVIELVQVNVENK